MTRLATLAVVAAMAAAAPAGADEGYRLAQTCAGCHGTNGGSPGETIPIIGGQSPIFLADAMRGYQGGERENYVMQIIAAGYGDDQIDSLAKWFGTRAWRATDTPYDADLAAAGATVAEQFCDTCHGPGGVGAETGPRLAGQPAAYLALAGDAYKTGLRSHAVAAAALSETSDQDIIAAAHHYASLR